MAASRKPPRWVYALAIPNLTLWILGLQLGVFTYVFLSGFNADNLALVPALVLQGEWWRILTFLVLPPTTHWIFLAFALYLFYLMGTALEAEWGALRYTLFWVVGWAANVAVSFLFPVYPGGELAVYTNAYLMTAIFLAFSIRFPNFTLNLFLILPVAVKWLALLTAGFWMLALLFGPWSQKLLILANSLGLALYFGKDLVARARTQHSRGQRLREMAKTDREPFHRCSICGATDQSHPERQFFYEEGVGICEVCAAQPRAST